MSDVENFQSFGLNEALLGSLAGYGFESPTQVQSHTIPKVISGNDIFALAKTGSGKTGAFAIPVIEKFLQGSCEKCIVLSPTRELAEQTFKFFQDIGNSIGVGSVCFIGGQSIEKQKREINSNTNIYVATPGRLCDLIKQKLINVKDCSCVVFDEADRLFEMGFQKDIEFILKNVQKDRQFVMVSATTNMEVLKVAYKYGGNPEEVKLHEDEIVVKDIDHKVAMIADDEKMPYLVNKLRENSEHYAIIFCNTQYMTHLVALWLQKMDVKAKAISGKLNQSKRSKLMEEFRSRELMILVCTDVAARGLDIQDVNLVINYDLPYEASNYVHRIGRTGRAGKSGEAISFCGYDDCENLDAINDLLGDKITRIDIDDDDFAQDLCPKPSLDPRTLKISDDKKRTVKKREGGKKMRTEERRTRTNRKPSPQRGGQKGSQRTGRREKQITKLEKIKYFEYESTNEAIAVERASRFFKLMDTSLLKTEVVSRGTPKFLFFGPRKTKYKFSVTPIFKRMLLPFLIDLFKKMDLKVFVRVSYKEPEVRVNISGEDIELFKKNKFELKRAVEQLVTVQLRQKIFLSPATKIVIRLDAEDRIKRRTEQDLLDLVTKTKNQILETNEAVLLDSLNPADRRIVHQAINDDDRFESFSKGEGRFKQIEISLRG